MKARREPQLAHPSGTGASAPERATPRSGRSWRDSLVRALTGPRVLRPVFAVLRRVAPIVHIAGRTVVTRHADVVEVLRRDDDFTIAEINAARMQRWSGSFFLGMDRGPYYEREHGALRRVVRPEDLPRVRHLVAETAASLVEEARPAGEIDAVSGLARVVPTRLVASYFGVPGPDEATTTGWMRAIFDAVFLDDGPRAREAAALAAAEQHPYLQRLIAERRAALAAAEPVPDDVLTRLVALGDQEAWLDDDAVTRNINGIIVGAVDTTSKAITHAVDELLRRPRALAGARAAALGGDIDAVRRYAYEALRFLPHGPVLARHCRTDARLGTSGKRIPTGRVVMAATLSAMFDPAAFADPRRFRADRPIEEYLHFGHGLHTCFGLQINHVQIPEVVAALLRLPGLRRAPGRAGRIAYDGPFPDRLLLRFER
jgi:cytochrome P450